jgi:tyrosine-protein kinase Etk/Wzc
LEYIRRLRDLKYNETVFELLAKEFEVAKLDEAREGAIIQVVDAAVPPDKKSSPHRLLIVIGATIGSFFIACGWVFLRESFNRACELPENHRRLTAIKDIWQAKSRTA